MKIVAGRLVGGLLAASLTLATASGGSAADGGMIRVDIYRVASKGPMNTVPCIITISGDAKGAVCHEVIRAEANKSLSGGKSTVLLGGDRVICEIDRSNSIQVVTPRALRPESVTPEARSWAQATFAPRARPGQTVELGVVPKMHGRTYAGGWLVRQEPHVSTEKHGGR
jgi:hypothetical protein